MPRPLHALLGALLLGCTACSPGRPAGDGGRSVRDQILSEGSWTVRSTPRRATLPA